jgi:hypothetical protein
MIYFRNSCISLWCTQAPLVMKNLKWADFVLSSELNQKFSNYRQDLKILVTQITADKWNTTVGHINSETTLPSFSFWALILVVENFVHGHLSEVISWWGMTSLYCYSMSSFYSIFFVLQSEQMQLIIWERFFTEHEKYSPADFFNPSRGAQKHPSRSARR